MKVLKILVTARYHLGSNIERIRSAVAEPCSQWHNFPFHPDQVSSDPDQMNGVFQRKNKQMLYQRQGFKLLLYTYLQSSFRFKGPLQTVLSQK